MKHKFTPLVVRLILVASLGLVNFSFAQYCMPTGAGALYNNSCNLGSNNYIKNVTLVGTTLNNTTGCTANVTGTNACNIYPATGSTTATLQQGITYNLSVTTSNNSIISVWIDYNHNNTFDASEWTQVAFASFPNVAAIVPITIPFTALTGVTGMRIRTRDDGLANAAVDACTPNWLSGELEQYTITINAAPPCNVPPVAGTTISTRDTVCPTTQFTLSLQGADIAQGLSQQWQWSLNGTSWNNFSGATATSLTTTQYQNTYYKCQVTCNSSTSTSAPILITMRQPTYYNNWGVGQLFSEGFESWSDACDDNDVPSLYWLNTPINGNESWRKQSEGFTHGQWSFPNGGFALVPHTGGGAADFHSFSGNGLPGTLDLFLNCTNFSSLNLSFWYFKNQNGFDKFEVYLSRNGGFSYDDTLITLRNSVAGQYGPVWINHILQNIPVNNSGTCIIRFKDFGDIFGTNDTGLDDVAISGILGTADLTTEFTNLSIYPNPSNGKIEIQCRDKNFVTGTIQLHDLTGRIVATDKFQNSGENWHQSIDWSNQPKGMYFVKLISESKIITRQLIIE